MLYLEKGKRKKENRMKSLLAENASLRKRLESLSARENARVLKDQKFLRDSIQSQKSANRVFAFGLSDLVQKEKGKLIASPLPKVTKLGKLQQKHFSLARLLK